MASMNYQKLMPAFIKTKVELQTSTPVASSDDIDHIIEQVPRPKLTNATNKFPAEAYTPAIGFSFAYAIATSI